ncbi:MAG: sigma-70 family RNA polymerase sigma factor [Cyclobacteriaceae bacterium]
MLRECQRGKRQSQDALYKAYYGYGMSICLRYSRTYEEAVEILNDGFIKIFGKLDKYTPGLSFKGWLRRVMINSAIDYYRRNEKHYHNLDISHAHYEPSQESALDQLSEQEIITAIQQLPPSYRMVFNLFAIEGYKHEEIGHKLGISVGTSKSNLAIARNKLKRILITSNDQGIRKEQNGG